MTAIIEDLVPASYFSSTLLGVQVPKKIHLLKYIYLIEVFLTRQLISYIYVSFMFLLTVKFVNGQ